MILADAQWRCWGKVASLGCGPPPWLGWCSFPAVTFDDAHRGVAPARRRVHLHPVPQDTSAVCNLFSKRADRRLLVSLEDALTDPP